jgi:hypothetical protein
MHYDPDLEMDTVPCTLNTVPVQIIPSDMVVYKYNKKRHL